MTGQCCANRELNHGLLRAILFLSLALAASGCFREVLLETSSLSKLGTEDIIVTMKDGGRYVFDGGSYTVTADSAGEKILNGVGKRYLRNESQYSSFDGRVRMTDVDRISTTENSPYFYGFLVGAAASIGFMIWMAPIWFPR